MPDLKPTFNILACLVIICCISVSMTSQEIVNVPFHYKEIYTAVSNSSNQNITKEVDLPTNTNEESCFTINSAPFFSNEINGYFLDQKSFNITKIDGKKASGKLIISPRAIYYQVYHEGQYKSFRPSKESSFYELEIGFRPDPKWLNSTYCSMKHSANEQRNPAPPLTQNGEFLRIYKMAIVSTGEYYVANGFNPDEVMDWLLFAVAGLNTIFERELAITFRLDDRIKIYNNAFDDPFVPTEDDTRVEQAGQAISELWDVHEYDIGHVLHNHADNADWQGGGVALAYTVCDSGTYYNGYPNKSMAWSGHFNNQDNDFVRLFAHEVGHQFGALHSFNGGGSEACDQQYSTGYEIGSGTTIMAYNGLCEAEQNIPVSGFEERNYFNIGSFFEILDFVESGATCYQMDRIGNFPPVFDQTECDLSLFEIPKRTPFFLTASATDPNLDELTYCWEQFDFDPSTQGLIDLQAANNELAPIFRSYAPSDDPIRVFPNMESILLGENDPFDIASRVERALNFRISVRDNYPGGGGIAVEEMKVNVKQEGPLTVSVDSLLYSQGDSLIIDWSTRNTDYLCDLVNIDLSLDGGKTYELNLAEGVPYSDEEYGYLIPGGFQNVRNTRIRVSCADHPCYSFFNVSEAFDIKFGDIVGEFSFCPETETEYSFNNIDQFDTYEWELNGTTVESNVNPIMIEFPPGGSFNELCLKGRTIDGFDISDCVNILINEVPVTMLNDSICPGECITLDGVEYCNPGDFDIPLLATNGCDSMVHFELKQITEFRKDFAHDLCRGDTIFFAGRPFTETGNFQESLVSTRSCDSLLNIDLNFITCTIDATYDISFINCDSQSPGSMILTADSGTPPFEFQWQLITTTLRGEGTLESLEDDVMYNNLPPGTYIATITDADGNQAIVIESVPEPIKVELNFEDFDGFNLACNGDETGVVEIETFGREYNFIWSNGSTNSKVENLSVGEYFVTVTDQQGCSIVEEFIISEPDPMIFQFGFEDPMCPGEDSGTINFGTVVNAAPPYTYSIDDINFQETPDFSNIAAAEYTLTVKDDNGCATTRSVELVEEEPVVIDLTTQEVVTLGGSVRLEANISGAQILDIEWSNTESLSCSDCLDPVASPFDNTEYVLTITDVDGCFYESTVNVVVVKNFDFYIPNVVSHREDDGNSVFRFSPGETVTSIRDFKIIDRWGQIIHEFEPTSELHNVEWDCTVNGEKMRSGVYVYSIEVEFLGENFVKQSGSFTIID